MSEQANELVVWWLRLKLVVGPLFGLALLLGMFVLATRSVMGNAVGFLAFTGALVVMMAAITLVRNMGIW